MHYNINSAIILAAGPNTGIYSIFGTSSSAMLPINGRPTLQWSLDYLMELGINEILLGVKNDDHKLKRFTYQKYNSKVQIVDVEDDFGPGYTLIKCLQSLSSPERCLVVLGDTLFKFPNLDINLFNKNFVLCGRVSDAKRWCFCNTDENNTILGLLDKPEIKPDHWPALIGVYYFFNTILLLEALNNEFKNGNKNLQLRHGLAPYINNYDLLAVYAAEWHDCGNIDSLNNSRRHLIQERSFNTIELNEIDGTILKKSKYTEKFIDEINYYRLLPSQIAIYFPRLVDYSIGKNETFIKLEYYGFPSLSEIFVFEELTIEKWEIIFKRLFKIHESFGNFEFLLGDNVVFDFYWGKTVSRINEVINRNKKLAELFSFDTIYLNNKKCVGWNGLAQKVEEFLLNLTNKNQGQIIHGDLCFSNILFDPISNLFKFIDPRGSFSKSGIYGDPRYDIAKLFHSIHGGYDYLIHDMFKIEHENNKIDFELFRNEKNKEIIKSFVDIFSVKYDFLEIRILEGLLFLSMCPLHSDNLKRQIAMFSIGIKIINEVFSNEDMY